MVRRSFGDTVKCIACSSQFVSEKIYLEHIKYNKCRKIQNTNHKRKQTSDFEEDIIHDQANDNVIDDSEKSFYSESNDDNYELRDLEMSEGSVNESIISDVIPIRKVLVGLPRNFVPDVYHDPPDWQQIGNEINENSQDNRGYFASNPDYKGNYSEECLAKWTSFFGISTSAVNYLRSHLFHDPKFKTGDITMESRKRQKRLMDTIRPSDRMQELIIYKDLRFSNKEKQQMLFVKHLHSVVATLADRYELKYWDLKLHLSPHIRNGVRFYNRHFGSSKRGQDCREYIRFLHGKDANILLLNGSFDKTTTNPMASTGSAPTATFPCYFTSGSLHPLARAESASMETVAHLPVLSNEQTGSTEYIIKWNLQTMQYCFDIILNSIEEGQKHGWWIIFKGETEPVLVYPILCLLILDYEAQQMCYCILHTGTHRPMVSCMCSKKFLEIVNEKGTCKSKKRTRAKMNALLVEGNEGTCRHNGIKVGVFPALFTQPAIDSYLFSFNDMLHTRFKGTVKNLIASLLVVLKQGLPTHGSVTQASGIELIRRLDDVIRTQPAVEGEKRFLRGFSCISNEQACELDDLIHQLPYVIDVTMSDVRFHTADWKQILLVLLKFVEFGDYIELEEHCDETVRHLGKLGFEYDTLFKASALNNEGNQCYPKKHMDGSHWTTSIIETGHYSNCSTNPFEFRHKGTKNNARNTSNNNRQVQVVNNVDRNILLRGNLRGKSISRFNVFRTDKVLKVTHSLSVPSLLRRKPKGVRPTHKHTYQVERLQKGLSSWSVCDFVGNDDDIISGIPTFLSERLINFPFDVILRLHVSFMGQIDYQQGGSSCAPSKSQRNGDNVCIVGEGGNVHYARLQALFQISIQNNDLIEYQLVEDDLSYAVVQYYEPLNDCRAGGDKCPLKPLNAKQTDKALNVELGIDKALLRIDTDDELSTRLTRLGKEYVTFPTCGEQPVPYGCVGDETPKLRKRFKNKTRHRIQAYGICAISSIIKRVRMWHDHSDTGDYPCFYADV